MAYLKAISGGGSDLSQDTVTPSDVLYGVTFHDSDGDAESGTMTNNGAVSGSIDGLITMSYSVPAGYHNGSGTVTLTDDIENALDAI